MNPLIKIINIVALMIVPLLGTWGLSKAVAVPTAQPVIIAPAAAPVVAAPAKAPAAAAPTAEPAKDAPKK